MEEFKASLEEKRNEAKDLSIRLEGIQDFLKNLEIENATECAKIEAGLKEELTDLQHKLAAAKADKGLDSAEATKLRNEIYGLKSKLELAREEKTASVGSGDGTSDHVL